MNQLLDKYLEVLTVEQTTLRRYRALADTHLRPLIGEEKAGRLDGEIVDSLYTELRRCRVHCKKSKGLIDHRTPRKHSCDERCTPHRCNPLGEGTIRKIHYILSGACKKTAPASPPEPESPRHQVLLDLRLLHLGDVARDFTATADPSDPEHLRRLLTSAARRHGGADADPADYELEVRRSGSPELLTTFATL